MNLKYQRKANDLIAGGSHTYSRGDDQFPLNAPPILERGEGCYVWDLDGNKFLDYGMALRSVTVGYGYKSIADAAITQILKGNNLTRASKVEVDAAEKMVNLIEGMDMIKFGKNGSTVTTAAIKLARAYTGKKLIARCLDHPFFSYDDWFIGDTVIDRGIPKEIKNLTKHFNFNDLNSLKQLFEQFPNQIACVILEAATHIEPNQGYLDGVKELAHKNDAVFIIDEMITGFRWHRKGAQKYYNITADLCTFGKAMANGFAVSALMGKKEIMRLGSLDYDGERVFLVSTTHGAEMSGLGALLETLNVYEELNVVEHMWDFGKKLFEGIKEITKELNIERNFYLEGTFVSPNFVCKDAEGNSSMAFRTLYIQEMIKNGVLMPYIALSYSHGEIELQETLEAARRSLIVYKQALEGGIENYLEGRAIKPVFRKIN